MSAEPIRRINLYDLYTVLIPGTASIVAYAPFFPENTEIGSLPLLLPLLIVGFIAGRIFQILAARLDSRFGRASHRSIFKNELLDPNTISTELRSAFYSAFCETFSDIEFPENPSDLTTSQANDVYVLTSDSITTIGSGKSQTFQALSDFFRSMWLISVVVGTSYYLYGVAKALDLLLGAVNYTSAIGTLGYPPLLIAFVGTFVGFGGFAIFSEAHTYNKRYYIQYLFTDFIVQNSKISMRNS